jgi:hypothetical protein
MDEIERVLMAHNFGSIMLTACACSVIGATGINGWLFLSAGDRVRRAKALRYLIPIAVGLPLLVGDLIFSHWSRHMKRVATRVEDILASGNYSATIRGSTYILQPIEISIADKSKYGPSAVMASPGEPIEIDLGAAKQIARRYPGMIPDRAKID